MRPLRAHIGDIYLARQWITWEREAERRADDGTVGRRALCHISFALAGLSRRSELCTASGHTPRLIVENGDHPQYERDGELLLAAVAGRLQLTATYHISSKLSSPGARFEREGACAIFVLRARVGISVRLADTVFQSACGRCQSSEISGIYFC